MNKHSIELFADQSLQCGEGPVWDPKAKCLFWTDSGGDQIFYANENDFKCRVFSKCVHAASLTLHAQGGLMLCSRERFYHLSNEGSCGWFVMYVMM